LYLLNEVKNSYSFMITDNRRIKRGNHFLDNDFQNHLVGSNFSFK